MSTDAYLVPAVAWQLGLRIDQVGILGGPHGTVLRVHKADDGVALPTLSDLPGVPLRTLARTTDWRVVTTCR